MLWVVAASVGGLVGCQTSYTIDLRNQTDSPVRATITGAGPGEPVVVYHEQWLGPGDRATLGPAVVERNERIDVTVDARSNAYAPASEQLDDGRTTIDIERTPAGRLILKRVGR